MDCYVRHILLISDLYDTRIFPYVISKKWLYIQVKCSIYCIQDMKVHKFDKLNETLIISN